MRQVVHDGRGSLQVRFPFDRDLVDRIKSLPNRRWHAAERYWFVPDNDALRLIELLADEGFEYDEATQEIYRSQGGTRDLLAPEVRPRPTSLPLFDEPQEPASTEDPSATDLTVGALNQLVHELIAGVFPGTVWLVGELSGFDKSAHRKHVNFELVDRDAGGRTVSKISAILFETTRRDIERELRRVGDPFRLEDEILVRFEVHVDLYVPWGQYRVVVERLDLNFTLGEAARRREEIVRRLTLAGLHQKNRALPLPATPLRVGLITSLGSDAYNDALRTLSESGFAFAITVHGARVQGQATEPSVLNALEWFAARVEQFDVVLITRGGGSRTDLIWFDTEALGRAVAHFPLPIVIGIGHEQDQSVLDALARSCKTPTAAAALLVETVAAALDRCVGQGAEILVGATQRIAREQRDSTQRARRLTAATGHQLELARRSIGRVEEQVKRGSTALIVAAAERLTVWARRIPSEARRLTLLRRERLTTLLRSLAHAARGHCGQALQTLGRVETTLTPTTRRRLVMERERITARQRRLHLIDPRRVLERGYAILRRADRRVLVDASAAQHGETLIAELKGGRLQLTADRRVTDTNGD